jgi:ribosomal protein S10
MVTVECERSICKKQFTVKAADRKRGWGRFCSKSCKAAQQSKIAIRGKHTAPTKYTQERYRRSCENDLASLEQKKEQFRNADFEAAMDSIEAGWQS